MSERFSWSRHPCHPWKMCYKRKRHERRPCVSEKLHISPPVVGSCTVQWVKDGQNTDQRRKQWGIHQHWLWGSWQARKELQLARLSGRCHSCNPIFTSTLSCCPQHKSFQVGFNWWLFSTFPDARSERRMTIIKWVTARFRVAFLGAKWIYHESTGTWSSFNDFFKVVLWHEFGPELREISKNQGEWCFSEELAGRKCSCTLRIVGSWVASHRILLFCR